MNILLFFFCTFDYTVEPKVEFVYDSNIFNYSKKYLEEFIQQINPERFPFETYDDLYASYNLQLFIRNKFFNPRTTTVNFNFTGYNYLVNNQKDYMIIAAGIRQSFGKWAIRFEYLLLPRYLIRYYKDPSGNSYIGCEFKENLFTIKTSLNANAQNDLALIFGYEIDDYIKNFDFYDSRAIRIKIDFRHKIGRLIEPSIDYEYKNSKANSLVPNISYQQQRGNLGFTFYLPVPRFFRINLGYGLNYRIYTSEISPLIDELHCGRRDITHTFNINIRTRLFYALSIYTGYIYEFRNSYSDVYENIGEIKDYNEWMLKNGLEFQY